MKGIAELDSIDLFWLVLFLVLALPTTYFGVILVGGNVVAVCLLILLLIVAAVMLLIGLAKWKHWLQRLALLLVIVSSWVLLSGITWSYFRNFC